MVAMGLSFLDLDPTNYAEVVILRQLDAKRSGYVALRGGND